MDKTLVDIIIPIYQPHKGWEASIQETMKCLHDTMSSQYCFHLTLVNDGVEELTFNRKDIPLAITYNLVNYEGNKGKGHAIRRGMENAKGKYIIFTDHDIPYGWKAMLDIINELEHDKEVVIPNRTSNYYQSLSRKRRWISRLLIKTNQLFFRLKHPDTQAGLKGIQSNIKDLILSGKEDGFLFEIEWIKKAEKRNLIIGSIPIELVEGKQLSSVGSTTLLQLAIAYFRLLLRH